MAGNSPARGCVQVSFGTVWNADGHARAGMANGGCRGGSRADGPQATAVTISMPLTRIRWRARLSARMQATAKSSLIR